MMLGKRPRPPMKRTTSMSEITFDLNTATTDVVPNNNNNNPFNRDLQQGPSAAGRDGPSWWKQQPPPPPYHAAATPIGLDLDQNQSRVLAGASPRNHRKQYSADLEADDFLRSCSLCKRRLVPTRDIYMYRGDSAFCSLECRQQQMNKDERKDKCCVASKKQVVAPPPSGSQVAT